MSRGRMLGFILIGGGLAVGMIVVFLIGSLEISSGARALGISLGLLVLVFPQWGFGAYFLWQGGQDEVTASEANKQRQLLNMVKTRGQVAISDLAIEMQASRDEVNHMLHHLVGLGLFSGYVNWDEGMLYSRQASELRQLKQCENCAGELALAGKGVIRCPFCGTEYFLD